jgi:hypothetical protein
MKSEQIKEITDRATEQLVAALNAGRSEALTGYLKAIGRFHRYSLHNVLLICSATPAEIFAKPNSCGAMPPSGFASSTNTKVLQPHL